MKIILVGPAYPYRGGIAAFNERLAQQFIREGHEVVLYTFTLQYPSFLFPGTTQYSTDPAPEGLTITRRISSVNPITWLRAARAMLQEKPDMVVFAYWMAFMAPCYTVIARRLHHDRHVRTVGLIHNMVPHEPTLLDQLFAPRFVARMDAFVALSHSVVDDIARLDRQSKPIALCPHPLYDNFGTPVSREEALSHLGLDATHRYVLFFGLIRDYKGLDLLMEAFADPRLADVRLIVAGECYGSAEKYEALEQRLALTDHIIWHRQFVPNDEVKHYFAAASIVAQPYRSATQSGVTQIAYHFERPMLVTNVGGLAEMVPDGRVGRVVSPDAPAIAEALVDFFATNREAAFTQGVHEEKAKYSWANMTAAISKCINPQ